MTISTCPSPGLVVETYVVSDNCVILGSIQFQNTGSLTLNNGILTIYGNLILMNNAFVKVSGGGIAFPQTGYSQYGIYLENDAVFHLYNSTFVTNNSTDDNFSMSLTAYDSALTVFEISTLDTNTGSWLLGNYNQNSQLQMISSLNLPTEVYPAGSAIVETSHSNFAGVWLNFNAGSSATVVVPTMSPNGVYNFEFLPSKGFNYSVTISESYCRLGFNSYPDSTMIITSDGSSTDKVPLVFGYYFMNNVADVTVSNLTVGNNITIDYADSGRLLRLQNVYLNPFSWQLYASNTNGYTVTVKDSIINELASFSSASMQVYNSVFQLAVLEAGGTNATLSVYNSQIWSQNIQAASAGVVNIVNCDIHGNFVNADGPGSVISFLDSTIDLHNGNASILNCNANAAGYTPNVNGVPLCNPYTPLHACAVVSGTNDGVINGEAVCSSIGGYPSIAPTAAPSMVPSYLPTSQPNYSPTISPSPLPSFIPTSQPNNFPTATPTAIPIYFPTLQPTTSPTARPSNTPFFLPTSQPSSVAIINNASSQQSSLSAGAIAGVVIGSTVGVIVFIAITYFLFKWLKNDQEESKRLTNFQDAEKARNDV